MPQRRNLNHQSGLAIIELVLTLPLLVLFFIALVSLGDALAQYQNVQRTVYEGAIYAGSIPSMSSSSGTNRVNSMVTNLAQLRDQNSHITSQPAPNVTYTAGSTANLPPASVKVQMDASMLKLANWQLDIDVSSVGPYFLSGNPMGNNQIFENPNPLVDCNGTPTTCNDRFNCSSLNSACPP